MSHECFKCRAVVSISLAATLSAFLLAVTYPGILSPDSIISWDQATRSEIFTIKPPLISLIQRLFVCVFPDLRTSIAVFSFVQATLFWTAIFSFMSVAIRGDVQFYISCLASAALFPIWPYPTTHWTDVWIVIFFLPALSAFILSVRVADENWKWLWFLVALLFAFLAISVRHNAPILLVLVMAMSFLWLGRALPWSSSKKMLVAVTVGGALLLASQIFYQFPSIKRAPSLVGLAAVNQYLGTIANSEAPAQNMLIDKERPAFDDAFGPGKLKRALAHYKPSFSGALVWADDFQGRNWDNEGAVLGFGKIVENQKFLILGLFRVMSASPVGFLRHKAAYLRGQFHTSSEIFPFSWGISNWGLAKSNSHLSFRPWEPGSKAIFSLLWQNKNTLFYRHWFMFLLGLSSLLIARPSFRMPALLLVSFGVLYALPYVFLETGFEWRYLMPSYVACWLSMVGAVLSLTHRT
jgi:hypothetical protein